MGRNPRPPEGPGPVVRGAVPPLDVPPDAPPLDVPLATPRLLLVPLTPALAEAALAGVGLPGPAGAALVSPGASARRDDPTCSPPRGELLPPRLTPAEDWPADEAGVVLARTALAGDASGQWLVALRSGLVVGECGLRAWSAPDEPEVGYGLAPSARGRGLATEAVGRLVEHLLARPGVRAVVARAGPDDAASRRVLRRLGFSPLEGSPEGRTPGLAPRRSGPGGAGPTHRRNRSP